MRVFCFPRERNIPSSVWWLIPRGNGGEKEQRRETSVGKECSFARALSLSSLSLSLSFLACTRAFLSSKVALSENLSQIHQNCGREGNETRLLMREKDFEREKGEPKKAEPKKNKRGERERETERFFFSRDESLLRSSNIQTHHSFRTTKLVFSTSHLSLSESLSLGLSQSLGVVAQKNTF